VVKQNTTNGTKAQEDFVLRAIERLRKGGYRGIHTVYSGFNDAFRLQFGKDSDPVGVTTRMAKDGKVVTRPVRGGVMLYKAGEEPATKTKGAEALAMITAS
jgi:hypothetical protein